jgi:hypothetical protein
MEEFAEGRVRYTIVLLTTITLAAQDAGEADRVLAQAREKIAAVAHRLPRYTCVETIHREYFEPRTRPARRNEMTVDAAPTSCASTLAHPAKDLAPIGWDRVRLEVAVAERREIESWPGASRFDSRRLDQIITTGPTNTGAFGTYLMEVFDNAGAQIEFAEKKGAMFLYRFRIPEASSHYRIRAGSGWRITGSSGSFAIDPATGDLTQLTIQTDVLPPEAQMCQAKTVLDYQHVRIGENDFLLPRSSAFETAGVDFSKSQSVTTFSACHEYTAESTLRFDDESSGAQAVAVSPPNAALPGGLAVSLALDTRIDSDTAAAGDVIFAHVKSGVEAPHSKRVLIPKGSRVRGRISEMKYVASPPSFRFGLLFDSVEINGARTPVALALERRIPTEPPPSALNMRTSPWHSRGVELQLPPPGSDGGGLFVFPATAGRYVIPSGYESKWITRENKP